MITRRGLLAGIFASATAPAIINAASAMKIFVPSKKIIVGRGTGKGFYILDEIPFYGYPLKNELDLLIERTRIRTDNSSVHAWLEMDKTLRQYQKV